ncbi:hypothetical protein M2132_001526 [Dysgonomonas sp. PH5-45]|nr:MULTISPECIES: hypothetical protein [unclassified Dysgonomonas]MDH6355189.1 hypothetical protein [Dysgonomonas sp. PH5-45]MDH6388085.1 hypothetical protein [Dysgonomonas sp. PH5-37]
MKYIVILLSVFVFLAYSLKALKENGAWRILCLQGFGFDEFMPTCSKP